MHGRGGNETRNHAIRESGNDIRLESDTWNVLHNGRQHRRAGGISADPDDHVWLKFVQHSCGGDNRARKIECGLQASSQADAIERAHFHKLAGEIRRPEPAGSPVRAPSR